MTFEDLLKQVLTIRCQETRSQQSDYCEIVLAAADIASLNSVLQSYFGPPLKAGGVTPSAEAMRCAKSHGGIQGNQTLYFNRETSELAMLWPWGNGQSVTLKLIRHA